MTLDEAIRHVEEVAKEQDKLCKRYDDASGYTRSGNEKIRTNEAKKCAVCAEEHRMLAWWLRDYKRLKEQEPCEDAVSRKALISHIENQSREWGEDYDAQQILGDIEDLPPVNPQEPKWIVSERLPEDGTYLVTTERIVGAPRIDMKSFAKDLNKVDEFDFPKHKCGWYDYDSEYGYWEDTKVIAWMPLPEPYKANCEVDAQEKKDMEELDKADKAQSEE